MREEDQDDCCHHRHHHHEEEEGFEEIPTATTSSGGSSSSSSSGGCNNANAERQRQKQKQQSSQQQDDNETKPLLASNPTATNRSISIATPTLATMDAFHQQEPLNVSTNVLLIFRLQEMRQSATTNLWLALSCLVYCGINLALLCVNYVNAKADRDDDGDIPVSKLAFHLLEFWATFGFSVVECLSLINTPKSLHRIYGDGRNLLVFKLILFFNIVVSFIPAFLITLNLHYFEILSHEIEYLNELTMTFVDLVLFFSLTDLQLSPKSKGDNNASGIVLTCMSTCVVLTQLGCYNLMGRTDDGCMKGEVLAHYLEFIFEIISSLIAFWFCMDNKFVADKEIGLILYGFHQDCRMCGASSTDFFQDYPSSTDTCSSNTNTNDNYTNPQPQQQQQEAINKTHNNNTYHHHFRHPNFDEISYSSSMCTPMTCNGGRNCGNARISSSRRERQLSLSTNGSRTTTTTTDNTTSYGSLGCGIVA